MKQLADRYPNEQAPLCQREKTIAGLKAKIKEIEQAAKRTRDFEFLIECQVEVKQLKMDLDNESQMLFEGIY